MSRKKVKGLVILLLAYFIAFVIGLLSFKVLGYFFDNVIINIFLANVLSTIIIWLIGIVFKTASVYDPYWSVQTPVIGICLMIANNNYSFQTILYLLCILFWSIRLTGNFIKTFHDLSYIDWRYKMLKEKTKSFYQIVNLLGIHLVPTIIVYVASLPFFIYIIDNVNFSIFNITGLFLMVGATLLELKADNDMHQFIKNRISRSEINRNGVWKNSRHPNYLGEILFWYGVALVLITSNLNYCLYIIGAILNNCLFLFISIPLAEKHMEKYKENYLQYKKEVRMLIPIKKLRRKI